MTSHHKPPAKGLMDEDGRGTGTVVLPPDEESSRMHPSMLRKIGPAMLVVALGVIAVYAFPSLSAMRPWKPGDPVPFWNVLGRPFEAEAIERKQQRVAKVDAIARDALRERPPSPQIVPEREVIEVEPGDALPPYEPRPDDDKPVEQSLELFEGHELDRFFHALARSDAAIAGAVTRVAHWGDSAIGVDGITSAIRTRMQARFGDAGHGFHVIAPPNTSYRHRGVEFRHNGEWSLCFIINKCRNDGHYGLGGTTVRSPPLAGAESRFAPDPDLSSGHVSRFEVWYAAEPRGGRIKVTVDDGPHTLTVRAGGGGRVRLYGVTLERDAPGVVWDGLALVGAFTRRMLEFDPEHLQGQLQHRAPDLVVMTFGGNDMIRDIPMEAYAAEYREVIGLVRRARPDMDCLIMSPLDHGRRVGVRIESLPVVPAMVQAQREVAQSEGCAFFDTYRAMGGEGAAGRWFRQTPRLVSGDLSHLTINGQTVIGEMFYRALIEAYVAYRRREG